MGVRTLPSGGGGVGPRAETEKQLAAIPGAKGKSSLKGKKVPPKYRSPSGETWAGRGARPRWMVDALKKREEDGRFPDRQVSTKGTDKAKVEALSFAHLRKFCKKF